MLISFVAGMARSYKSYYRDNNGAPTVFNRGKKTANVKITIAPVMSLLHFNFC